MRTLKRIVDCEVAWCVSIETCTCLRLLDLRILIQPPHQGRLFEGSRRDRLRAYHFLCKKASMLISQRALKSSLLAIPFPLKLGSLCPRLGPRHRRCTSGSRAASEPIRHGTIIFSY